MDCIPGRFNQSSFEMNRLVQAPGVRGFLFRQAVATKLANIKAGAGVRHAVWDRLLFSKVAALLGGRVRLMM